MEYSEEYTALKEKNKKRVGEQIFTAQLVSV